MTRYFYTDPLAAAWMAKHVGMTFWLRETDTEQEEVLSGESDVQWAREALGVTEFEIHSDSLRLLEPTKTDKVSYMFGFGSHAGEAWDEVKGVISPNDEGYPYTGNGESYVLTDGGDAFPLSRLKQIFQRDGKPFLWPESEEE